MRTARAEVEGKEFMMRRQKPGSADPLSLRSGDDGDGATARTTGFSGSGFGAGGNESAASNAAGRDIRTAESRIEGTVDGVAGRLLAGWAWDPGRPYEPLDIEIYAGNTKLGHGRADVFDLELARTKIGNGMHRFEIGLERLPPGAPPFVLRFVVAGTDVELGPAITLSTLADAEHLLSASDYRGRIAGLNDGVIRGWAVNRRNPHERPTVNLRDGGVTISTSLAGELSSEAVEAGVVANVYKFELSLPASLLDGKLHQLSVTAGEANEPLEGSPLLFGPGDMSSLGRELTVVAEHLQRIDLRIQALGPAADETQLQNRIATRILDRIDTLLNVYRDSIERELSVIRRQLTQVMKHIPALDPDVIVMSEEPATIEKELAPEPTAFSLASRAVPLISFDLTSPAAPARVLGAISHSDSASGLRVSGEGAIELGENVSAPASLIMSGNGGKDPLEFCNLTASLDGHPLSGRMDVFDDGRWNYIGTTIAGTVGSYEGLRLAFLGRSGAPRNPFTLESIAVFGHGRAPFSAEDPGPRAGIVYLGVERLGTGWYDVEAGGHGGVCWMGAVSETLFNLRSARTFLFRIPELRPLSPEIMPKLQISIGGFPVKCAATPMPGDSRAFTLEGRCVLPEDTTSDIVFRISFPPDSVHSPLELGINNDARPLTIAVRAIALCAES